MRNKLLSILAITLLLAPIAFSQSKETGAVHGIVTDEQGAPLPGVNVTISSRSLMGIRTFVTDANGEFRFPALPPGEYQVKAELQGFGTVVREKIRVNTTSTLNIDIKMKAATISEEVTVIAQSPTVDVKSTETASVTLSNEILRNVPNNQFTANIVNLAPGVNDNVAYGASQNTGIAYTMDGVNVADPEGGSAWVFSDYNIIEEAKVMGIGLPAEYGNFTGVIFNLVTKSGGNEFSGHFEFNFQGYQADSKFWQANNNAAYLDDFPALTSPSSKLMDINGHIGGPIVKDKLWFYVGGQFYRTQNRPTGFPEDVDYKQPRFFIKLTSQLTPTLNMSLACSRGPSTRAQTAAPAPRSPPEATVTQDSPDWLVGFSLTKILSPKTFFDLKTNYFEGIYYLDPEVGFDAYCPLRPGRQHAARQRRLLLLRRPGPLRDQRQPDPLRRGLPHRLPRVQVRRRVRTVHGPEPLRLSPARAASWVTTSSISTTTATATRGPTWPTSTRATTRTPATPGSRPSSRIRGRSGNGSTSASASATARTGATSRASTATSTRSNRLAPRLGFTFDILGDKTTILKAHYGHFTEAMLTGYHDKMNPDGELQRLRRLLLGPRG